MLDVPETSDKVDQKDQEKTPAIRSVEDTEAARFEPSISLVVQEIVSCMGDAPGNLHLAWEGDTTRERIQELTPLLCYLVNLAVLAGYLSGCIYNETGLPLNMSETKF
jgi:hypothetical protein